MILNPSSMATPAAFTPPIEKSSTEGRWRRRTKLSRYSFCIADWVVNICATFSLCTPLSCFLGFARPLPMFRWAWCQGLCMSSSHGCSWKMSRCDCELSPWWHIEQILEVLWVELIENYMNGLVNSQKLLQHFLFFALCCDPIFNSWSSAFLSFSFFKVLEVAAPGFDAHTLFEAGGQTQTWVAVGPKSHLLSRALPSQPRSLSAGAGVDPGNSNR